MEHYVDGFRLDALQATNKDLNEKKLIPKDLTYGEKAPEIIKAVFEDKDTFLIMECFDPTMGNLTEYYANVGVDFVMNVQIKEQAEHEENYLIRQIANETKSEHYMLDLESHDSPRFPSRGIEPENEIWIMFNSNAKGICLYQGQELALYNPSSKDLTTEMLIDLDAETAMRVKMGEDPEDLRPNSRANARIPIPLLEYSRQEQNHNSYLNLTKRWIQLWRKRP